MKISQTICNCIRSYLENNSFSTEKPRSERGFFYSLKSSFSNYFPIFAAVYHEAYHQNAKSW